MGVQATVVFTDLHGSTAVFEALGNVRATETVTQITDWIVREVVQQGGRVIKTLGDGVLALFPDGTSAVHAAVDLQRLYLTKMFRVSNETAMPIRIGMATGDVEMVAGDCYGDAVNVAARLCGLCGPNQIWCSAVSLHDVHEAQGVTFRILGPIPIRGRAEPCTIFQIEWREEEASEFLTMQGDADPRLAGREVDALGRDITLTWLDTTKHFRSFDLPIHIGRVHSMNFMVNDARVSRTHARLEWRNGSVVFVDVSSYGSWVRFGGIQGSDVLLRREECVLHGEGELAFGAPFSDATVPTVHFSIS